MPWERRLVHRRPGPGPWSPDTTAPITMITGGPSGHGADRTRRDVHVRGRRRHQHRRARSCSSARSTVRAFAPCESPSLDHDRTVGGVTFPVRAIDAAGNVDVTPAERNWSMSDLTAPDTTIDAGPRPPTTATSATITLAADERAVTYECSLDGAAFAACSAEPVDHRARTGHAHLPCASDRRCRQRRPVACCRHVGRRTGRPTRAMVVSGPPDTPP